MTSAVTTPLTNRPWRSFSRNRPAMLAAAFLTTAAVVLLVTLPFSTSWFDVQDLHNAVRAKPTPAPVVDYQRFEDALTTNAVGQNAKFAAPVAYRASAWFGCDSLGRSTFFRCLLGWAISLAVGLAAAAVSVTIGVAWGAVAALAGGKSDALMMRVVDVLYGLPYILLVILLKVAFEPVLARLLDSARAANLVILFLAIGAVSWLTMARVIRGQVLALVQQPFIEAARSYGLSGARILFRHLLPNLVGPIVVYATLIIPQAILQESFLSFLGIGIQPPVPTLGSLAAGGLQALNTFVGFWWLIVFPCALLVLTLLALNFIGDGLRDALDPRSTKVV